MNNVLLDVEVLGVTCRTMAHLVAKLVPVLLYDCTTAIDLTPGSGAFWSDKEAIPFPVLLSPNDFLDTPYAEEAFDATFFDPPHLAGQGARAFMRERYGTYTARELPGVIYHGAKEAWRITHRASGGEVYRPREFCSLSAAEWLDHRRNSAGTLPGHHRRPSSRWIEAMEGVQ